MNQFISKIILFSLFGVGFVSEASAKDCLPNGGVCVGDSVFITVHGVPTLSLVQAPLPKDGTTTISVSGQQVDLSDVARLSRKNCGKNSDGKSLCPGDAIKNGDVDGIVLAAYDNGELVLAEPKKAPSIVEPAKFSPFTPNCVNTPELREAIKGFNYLQTKLKTFSPGQSCPIDQVKADAAAKAAAKAEELKKYSCDQPNVANDGDDSPNLDKFKALLAKGSSANLDDFLILWYPDHASKVTDSPAFACEKEENGYLKVDSLSSNVDPTCSPRVLYSWGPQVKLDTLKTRLPDDTPWKGIVNPYGMSQVVFASDSAASTFGYGLVLVRIEVKDGIPYHREDYGAQDGEVGVRQDIYHDFAVHDASVIENWSYGTPEIYDELVRDILQFKSKGRVSTYLSGALDHNSGLNRLWAQAEDGHIQNEDELKARLLELIREILQGEGKIFYNLGTCRNRTYVYSTNQPSFIDPIQRSDKFPKWTPPPAPVVPAVPVVPAAAGGK